MISQILRGDIETYAEELREQSALLIAARNGSVTSEMIGRYLASIHVLLAHTPLHLARAKERAEAAGLTKLAAFYEEKLREEVGHDRWAEQDMCHLRGMRGEEAVQRPVQGVLDLIRSNEEAIARSPHHYLAYILFAEYLIVVLGPEWVHALVEKCGVPLEALTAVTHHVELDQNHVIEDCREIDELVDPSLLDPLRAVLRATMSRFTAFFDDVYACAA